MKLNGLPGDALRGSLKAQEQIKNKPLFTTNTHIHTHTATHTHRYAYIEVRDVVLQQHLNIANTLLGTDKGEWDHSL